MEDEDGNNSSLLLLEDEDVETHIFDNQTIRVTLVIVYSIVFFFCFFGNLTVVLVTIFHWRMRSVTKFCLANLAISNLCVGIFCIYQNLSLHLFNGWMFGKLLCKMYHFTNNLSHTASVLTLVVISVERYMAILHPFRCRQILTLQTLRLIIAGVWIVSAMVCSPQLYHVTTMRHPFLRKQDSQDYQVICVPSSAFVEHLKTADTCQFLLLFLGPMIIISVLYLRIGVFLRQRDKYRSHLVNGTLFNQGSCPRLGGHHPKGDVPRDARVRNRRMTRSESESGRRNNKVEIIPEKAPPPLVVVPNSSMEMMEPNSGSLAVARKMEHPAEASSSEEVKKEEDEEPEEAENVGSQKVEPNTMVRSKFSRRPIKVHRMKVVERFKSSNQMTSIPRPHKPVIRMLMMVVLAFAFCNLPFHIRKLYQNYFPKPYVESELSEILVPVSFLMMYANCAINPFLYGFVSKSFRSCLMDFLRCELKKPAQPNLP